MTEHVVLKNIKSDLRFIKESKVKAGMSSVSVDAGQLEWLVEQAEQTESFKELHKKYLDRFVDAVGERNSLKEENERLKTELELAKPLFSRRQLIAENKRLREALQFYADEDNNLLVDGENTTVSIDGGRTAREALGGASID